MTDARFDEPDLTAEELAALMRLTPRQVKDRVAKDVFKCHWRGNHRGMRFTPEDVAYNRSMNAGGPVASAHTPMASAQLLKGVARLRKAQSQSGATRTA